MFGNFKLVLLIGSIFYVFSGEIPLEGTPPVPPGGQTEVNVTDKVVIANAWYAVNYINYLSGYSGMTYRESLAEIDSGTSQVVDGDLFRLTIHIGTSFCTNNDLNANRTDCAIQPGLKHRQCNVAVLYKHWINSYFVLNLTCDPKQPPDTVRQAVDVNDIKVIKAASYAVDEINHRNGYSPFDDRLQLAEIDGGTNEVLDGADYELTIHIGPSICPNIPVFNGASKEQCPLIRGKPLKECKVNVVYRPWSLTEVYTMTSQCESEEPELVDESKNHRNRRSISIDPSDSFYIRGAEYAIGRMNAENNHMGSEFKLAFVNVTGGSYVPYGYSRRIHLDIEVGDSECKFGDTTPQCPLKEDTTIRHCSLSMDYHFLMQRFVLHEHHCDE